MKGRMQGLRTKLKDKPHLVLSVPALLCFISFITNFIASMQDGNIDSNELHQLLSTADGFETVVMVVVILVLREKKK